MSAKSQETEAAFKRIYSLIDATAIVAQAFEGEEPRSASFLLSELQDAVEELERRLQEPEAKGSAHD